jgi:thiamine biosynthesis lipoprotein
MKRLVLLLGAVAVLAVIFLRGKASPTVISGRAMGCEWKLVTDEKVDRHELQSRIAGVLEHWEQVLSTWRADSDLSRHNRGEAASEDLGKVLTLADHLRQESGGAFDHRMLGNLTAAGFGPGGSGIDLSSIGKGYAVDRVCEMLARQGIHRHVFSLAGEVRAGSGSWPVEIESPSTGVPGETLHLQDNAMATSGNYRQWNGEQDGKLVSHLLDPATGKPVLRPPCSVTVIGPDAALASGWATALFVLGPDRNPLVGSESYQVIWKGPKDAWKTAGTP